MLSSDAALASFLASSSDRTSISSTAPTVAEEEDEPYWMEPGWVPCVKSGKQRSPNMIRNELQRYLNSSPGVTVGEVLAELGVSNASYYKFMNPGTYKDQWSATQNGTYWAAARFLEARRNKPKKAANKRKNDENESSTVTKKSKNEAKMEMILLMSTIQGVAVDPSVHNHVYDSCPEIVKKINQFLARDGVTKKDFCDIALGGANSNSLNTFLSGKKQDQCGNQTYRLAWIFFEKMRIHDGKPKTKKRIKTESEMVGGYSLVKARAKMWIFKA